MGNVLINHPQFWFYFRKAYFQGVMPLTLGFITFYDMLSVKTGETVYYRVYFYTSLILLLYAQLRTILDFIFRLCSEDIVIKKELNLLGATQELLYSMEMSQLTDKLNENYCIVLRKVYKLRYAQSKLIRYVDKLSWILGLDSPLLIPFEMVAKLGNVKQNPTIENEEIILRTTLNNLYRYRPEQYVYYGRNVTEHTHIVPTYTLSELDSSILDIQREIFDIKQKNNIVNEV